MNDPAPVSEDLASKTVRSLKLSSEPLVLAVAELIELGRKGEISDPSVEIGSSSWASEYARLAKCFAQRGFKAEATQIFELAQYYLLDLTHDQGISGEDGFLAWGQLAAAAAFMQDQDKLSRCLREIGAKGSALLYGQGLFKISFTEIIERKLFAEAKQLWEVLADAHAKAELLLTLTTSKKVLEDKEKIRFVLEIATDNATAAPGIVSIKTLCSSFLQRDLRKVRTMQVPALKSDALAIAYALQSYAHFYDEAPSDSSDIVANIQAVQLPANELSSNRKPFNKTFCAALRSINAQRLLFVLDRELSEELYGFTRLLNALALDNAGPVGFKKTQALLDSVSKHSPHESLEAGLTCCSHLQSDKALLLAYCGFLKRYVKHVGDTEINLSTVASLASWFCAADAPDEAQELLKLIPETSYWNLRTSYLHLAGAYARIGNRDKALELVEQSKAAIKGYISSQGPGLGAVDHGLFRESTGDPVAKVNKLNVFEKGAIAQELVEAGEDVEAKRLIAESILPHLHQLIGTSMWELDLFSTFARISQGIEERLKAK